MRVYCIKTWYNNGKYATDDYVIFKKGHFYETKQTNYNTCVMREGMMFPLNKDNFVSEEEWRDMRINEIIS